MKTEIRIISLILALALFLCACDKTKNNPPQTEDITVNSATGLKAEDIPDFSGSPYITVNSGKPDFKKTDLKKKSYEYYSKPDRYGRCRECCACIGFDLMPSDERESISEVTTTGWQSIQFDFIDGGNLYNRCHLIAYMLTGENANENNLITGTRYLNIEGMLPFEEMTGNYIRKTHNHVVYRVTPIFKDDELVARGVQMEAYSVEDKGKGISFNVFCYNIQPGVIIDYRTGKAEEKVKRKETSTEEVTARYVLNKKSMKIHKPDCRGVKTMSAKNKEFSNKTKDELLKEGYTPCGECNP